MFVKTCLLIGCDTDIHIIMYLTFSDVTDPVGDVMTFIRNFNDKYGADQHPTFYQGSYSQVSRCSYQQNSKNWDT